jgi:hypothetical protein
MRIARALREEFRERGTIFKHGDYLKALAERLQPLRDRLYRDAVANYGDKVDRDSTCPFVVPDAPVLPGFDLEGELRLGEGERVAKKYAHRDHAERAMLLDDENLLAVQAANIAKRKELLLLTPYWGAGVPKEDAVAAYLAANPGEGAA